MNNSPKHELVLEIKQPSAINCPSLLELWFNWGWLYWIVQVDIACVSGLLTQEGSSGRWLNIGAVVELNHTTLKMSCQDIWVSKGLKSPQQWGSRSRLHTWRRWSKDGPHGRSWGPTGPTCAILGPSGPSWLTGGAKAGKSRGWWMAPWQGWRGCPHCAKSPKKLWTAWMASPFGCDVSAGISKRSGSSHEDNLQDEIVISCLELN